MRMRAKKHRFTKHLLGVAVIVAIHFSLAPSVFSALPEAGTLPVVTVSSGLLQGIRENNIEVFRGIRYAAPPKGNLRWRAPQAVQAWEGVKKADAFGCACMQGEVGARRVKLEKSEDCLTLNIWRPVQRSGLLPVMVWIHGGAFQVGNSGMPFFDGTKLAKQGVVLVSINYRIGRFGFFAHPLLTADRNKNYPEEPLGNYGLMDQLFALEWVQKNIKAFGGDPEQVTIFGESAGGASVYYLATSPKSTGLFSGAIAESGGGFQDPTFLDKPRGPKKSLSRQGQDWSNRLGHPINTVADLRNVSTDEIIAAKEPVNIGFGPVIDGDIVVDDIINRFESGKMQPVPYLIGGNSFEGSLMKMTKLPAEKALATFGKDREAVIKLYQPYGIENIEDIALTAYGDTLFLAPARAIAGAATRQGRKVWLYHFDYVPSLLRLIRPGTMHGGEIPFVFGTLDKIPLVKWGISDRDEEMAQKVMAYWVAFAKYGNPNPTSGGYANWPAFSTNEKPTMVFTKEGIRAYNDFLEERLQFFIKRRLHQGN